MSRTVYKPCVMKVSAKYRHRTMDDMESSVLRASTALSTGRVSGEAGGEALLVAPSAGVSSIPVVAFSSLQLIVVIFYGIHNDTIYP